jgi:hypothetical protein
MYIDTPLNGKIYFNPELKQNIALFTHDPYGEGWLFRIQSDDDLKAGVQSALEAKGYADSLKNSEGLKNPKGLKGGVSGICKAVYSGIRDQKISK